MTDESPAVTRILPTGSKHWPMFDMGRLEDEASEIKADVGQGDILCASADEVLFLIQWIKGESQRHTADGLAAAYAASDAWDDSTFGPGNSWGKRKHLMKEALEIIHADDQGLAHELADADMIIHHLAHNHGIDLAKAITEKLAINESRIWPDWRKVPDGLTVEHLRSADELAARKDWLPLSVGCRLARASGMCMYTLGWEHGVGLGVDWFTGFCYVPILSDPEDRSWNRYYWGGDNNNRLVSDSVYSFEAREVEHSSVRLVTKDEGLRLLWPPDITPPEYV